MTFDFESLSAKVGPLLRIDLSQEGHGEKKFQKFSQKFVSFRQKMLDFVKKCCLKKFFLHRDLQNFCHVEHQETKKKFEKKICQKVKNIFKSVAAIRQVFLKSLFFRSRQWKIFFFKMAKTFRRLQTGKTIISIFCNFFIFAKTRSVLWMVLHKYDYWKIE